ncbi:c-type cytochrome [Ramlibacter albus]|uniref:Cytochrome c4 n=1 Tax=Ramlibacter albus TaxID=2079448 RepID=A0A923M3F0_9BURK|nr:c-type cytochrome [Ramlibacter albus]MBC5763156.1 cytochrome c4 [Ramlibacter albus]
MNKLLTLLFALGVACATSTSFAQASAPAAAAKSAASAPAPQAPAGAKSLEAKIAMCIGCHGIKGYQASFPEVHKVPMISGQGAKYIAAALNAYRAGDRKHPTMRGIASSLSDQDITDIANFYASQAVAAPATVKEPTGNVAELVKKGNCAACHGPNLSKPIDPSYPKIAGQYSDYMFVVLKAYKTENNPSVGRSNGVMGAIAKQFSNAELKALASYVGSLDGELTVHPEPKFR